MQLQCPSAFDAVGDRLRSGGQSGLRWPGCSCYECYIEKSEKAGPVGWVQAAPDWIGTFSRREVGGKREKGRNRLPTCGRFRGKVGAYRYQGGNNARRRLTSPSPP